MNPEIDISGVTLHTPRLILRPWRQTDLEDLYTYASVPEVGPMAGWKPHESREETQNILDLFIAEKKTFALEYQGRVIGSLGIEKYYEAMHPELDNQRCRELGFVLAKDCWGLGLMPEAVNEAVRWLFEEAGLDVILCGHFLWNRQSERVQEKCGFRYCGRMTRNTGRNIAETLAVRILTREDWLSAQEKKS